MSSTAVQLLKDVCKPTDCYDMNIVYMNIGCLCNEIHLPTCHNRRNGSVASEQNFPSVKN